MRIRADGLRAVTVDEFELSWPEMTAASDRTAINAILSGRSRPGRKGRVLSLAKALQAAAVLTPDEAARVAGEFMRGTPVHAASHALWLLWGYAIRPLAVLALESRPDVRALLLQDPECVLTYAGDHLIDELHEAREMSRSINARIACEEALK